MITHELRTPLHGILGSAELLNLEGDLAPTQSKHVPTMITAGEHLLGLINSVLDLAKIEAGKLELDATDIEMSEFARSCLDLVRSAAAAKGLGLVLTATQPLHVRADPVRCAR